MMPFFHCAGHGRVILTAAALLAGVLAQAADWRSLDAHRVDPLEEEWRWQRIRELEIGDIAMAAATAEGTMAIAGGAARLWVYDGYQSRPIDIPDELGVRDVNAIAITADGRYCAVSSNAILLQDGDGWKKVADAGISQRPQNNILKAAGGILWIGLDEGIARVDPETGTCRITPMPAPVLSLCKGPSGDTLWVALAPRGEVREYRLRDGQLVGGDAWRAVAPALDRQILAASLLRASDGRIWYVNSHHNLPVYLFDPQSGGWEEVNLSRRGGDNLAFSILETPDGAIWISSRGTLHILRDGNWRIYHSPEIPLPGARSTMVQSDTGHVTIIEASGINVRVDHGQQQGISFNGLHFQDETADGGLLFISIDNEVVHWRKGAAAAAFHSPAETGLSTPGALLVHSSGDWFLSGSHQREAAVAIFDGASWRTHTFPEVGLTFGHLALLERPNGEVWLGCAQMDIEFPGYLGGIVVFTPDASGGYTASRRSPPQSIFRNWSLQSGPGGRVFTSGNGLFEYTPSGVVPVPLPPEIGYKWIDQVTVDARGDLWCAVWSLGLFRLRDGEWTQYTEADGLDNNLTSFVICLDGEHPVASTREGHYRFDGQRWSPFMGHLAGLYRGSGRLRQARDDGSIWINHTHVDWYYRGQRVEPYAEDKKRTFRTLQYIPDKQGPLTQWASPPPELFRNTDLVFRWKGVDAWGKTPRQDLQFSHRINGGEWAPFTPEETLILSELPGGRHTIEVRARDADFNISAEPLRAGFTVIPPLWRQAWFIASLIASAVFVIAVVTLFIRQRVRHILEIEAVKMRFFTHLSHEIKTPLSLILGPVERLQNEVAGERHQHYLSLIKSNSQRLLFLVNQLLDFRKLQLNKLDYLPEEGDFIPFARSCLSVFEGWVREKGQALALETELEHFICLFPHEILHKVIDNLVNNAIKYTPAGGRITVRVRRVESGDKRAVAVIEVEDTGPGVPESEQAAIFEPFYRSAAGDDFPEGSGIGLAFVKELCESIGATIELKSPVRPEASDHPGSCFRVAFPVRIDAPARTGGSGAVPAPRAESVEAAPTAPEEGVTDTETEAEPAAALVLLVEDNLELREFIRGELSGFARIETADAAQSGFERARELIPDIVLSDVVMPGRSGFELCRDLKKDPHTSHIPLVLLTALRSEEHKRQAYECGADDFITKPVSPEILRLKLRNILATQQHSRERVRRQFVDDNRITGLSKADQAFLDKVREIVDEELSSEQFDVNALAEKMGFSRSAFYRKFNSLTDLSPAAFIRVTRLRQAAKWLVEGGKSVAEIAYDVGFSDAGYFSRVFKDEYKCSPSEFARQADS